MRTMPTSASLLSLSMILALAACGDAAPDGVVADQVPSGIPHAEIQEQKQAATTSAVATASLAATVGSTVSGDLRFEAMDGGVHITGRLVRLEPNSAHGFHVHETGDCSAPDGSSAGGHFNPDGSAHGRVGTPTHHAGDSNNIVADPNGDVVVDNRLEGATLGDGAATDIVGKAVIVHAGADDYTSQPTGDAGARLACGVIQATS
ncbi:MAG: superoxide dismutase family protein [Luteimonas sp.]